jgi:tetratricopeptide (TPR) repeat protein
VVLFLTGILLSESRAGIIALLFMGVFYLFWYLKAKTRKISFQKKPVLLFTAGTLFLGLLTVLYKVKRGSANGRLLIWISSWKMVLDKPILGHRTNSFAANYMLYQADYFANNPDSRFSELADNIIHPFNEYLSCLIQYGAVGFILFVLFLVYIVRQGLKWALKEKLPALISLLGLGIFGLFSYPMYYALILIIVSVNLYIISCSPRKNHSYGLPTLLLLPVVVPLTCFAVSGSIKTVRSEKKWEQLRNAVTLSANAGDILAGYATLRSQYADNPLFLYNYGAVLNGYGCYEKSIRIFKECERFLNNCELQSYLADNYMKTNEYARAESCAILASRMCPSRFMPLYQLVLVYDQTNRTGKAVELAKEVIVRPVKVWNPNSYLIKVKLQEFIKSKEPGGTFVGKAYN